MPARRAPDHLGVIGFFVFLLSGPTSPIDEVTKGEGKAIPSSKVQKIQNLEGGIVAKSSSRKGRSSRPAHRCAWTTRALPPTSAKPRPTAWPCPARRTPERRGRRPPAELPEDVLAAPNQAKSEESLYISRRQQLQDEIGGLQEQLMQRQQELREFSSKQAQYANSLSLLRQEINMSEPLVAQGAVSPVEVLRLKRAEVETRGQLDATTLAIPRAEAAIKEATQDRRDARQIPQRSADSAQRSPHRPEQGPATSKALEDRVSRTWSPRRCAVSSSNCWSTPLAA
jgi:adhesin transport system membrane fusion protein